MRRLNAIPIYWVLALILSIPILLPGCVAMPPADTMNKKMAVIEVSYSETVNLLTTHRKEGRLSPSQILIITESFKQADAALNAMHTAIKIGNEGLFNDKAKIVNNSLKLLRDILRSAEGGAI